MRVGVTFTYLWAGIGLSPVTFAEDALSFRAGRLLRTAMPITPPPGGFVGPIKRSVTIAGHETSISLEPVFWAALETAAQVRALPMNALVAAIDAARIEAPNPPNLASAIRSWLVMQVSRVEINSQ